MSPTAFGGRTKLCCVLVSEVSPGPSTALAVIRDGPSSPPRPSPRTEPSRAALPPQPPAPHSRPRQRGPPPSPAPTGSTAHGLPAPRLPQARSARPCAPACPAGLRYPHEAQVVVCPFRDARHHIGRRSVRVRRLRGGGLRPARHVAGFPRARVALLGQTAGGAALLGRTARIRAPQAVRGAARWSTVGVLVCVA